MRAALRNLHPFLHPPEDYSLGSWLVLSPLAMLGSNAAIGSLARNGSRGFLQVAADSTGDGP